MNKYMVWDEPNNETREPTIEIAIEIEARDPEGAAIEYARQDVDGEILGAYVDGNKLIVEDASTGVRTFCEVVLEVDPSYYVRNRKPSATDGAPRTESGSEAEIARLRNEEEFRTMVAQVALDIDREILATLAAVPQPVPSKAYILIPPYIMKEGSKQLSDITLPTIPELQWNVWNTPQDAVAHKREYVSWCSVYEVELPGSWEHCATLADDGLYLLETDAKLGRVVEKAKDVN